MSRISSTVILFFFCLLGQSQQILSFKYNISFNCHQNHGCDSIVHNFPQDLIVRLEDGKLLWTKSIFESWNSGDLRKNTNQYCVSLQNERYVFVALISKSLYYIDYFRGTYRTHGFGTDAGQVRKNVNNMMMLLKAHKTQKDVIQYLIDQSV